MVIEREDLVVRSELSITTGWPRPWAYVTGTTYDGGGPDRPEAMLHLGRDGLGGEQGLARPLAARCGCRFNLRRAGRKRRRMDGDGVGENPEADFEFTRNASGAEAYEIFGLVGSADVHVQMTSLWAEPGSGQCVESSWLCAGRGERA